MNTSNSTAGHPDLLTSAALLDDDRRFNERTRLLRPAVIRLAESAEQDIENYGTVIDLSRDGLYFTARGREYTTGMVLHILMPESNSQCTCEVVRTEQLPNGSLGVGVRVVAW